jgi:hypothetical protein
MASLAKLLIPFKALAQLGLQAVSLNALYRFGLVTGHYRRLTARPPAENPAALKPLLPLPDREALLRTLGEDGRAALLAEADEIIAGSARLFSGEPVPLALVPPQPLAHWTAYESGKVRIEGDVKFVWEPARFGWAYVLGRAYHVSKNETYAETFWRQASIFLDANPPYLGPHWMSGQEVAIRLMAFVWAAGAFAGSAHSTPERLARLAVSVAAHAARIPPTLVYARSQNNNHLLSEAAGLFTAGLALPGHPSGAAWRALGWKWLVRGFTSQIDGYGEYTQHSTNYHRLMLHLALWTDALLRAQERPWPRQVAQAVGRSVHWLLALLDPAAGRTPNLGANDGALIFPLSICPFDDYRPVAHAAARTFLRYDLPRGPWDECALWFGLPLEAPKTLQLPRYLGDQIYGKEAWAYLRTAQFTSRPSHADQLHLDLWWRGLNVARDAGTYLYNADPPWDNALTTALVHNTVTVDGQDQMTRAGRFLYLDWVNVYRTSRIEADERILQRVTGRHYAYKPRGVRHTRIVSACADGSWQVQDEMLLLRLPWQTHPLDLRLHWLLPDWEWSAEQDGSGFMLHLQSPHGPVRLLVTATEPFSQVTLARAGERVFGTGAVSTIMGWESPTYGVKIPALSLAVEVRSTQSVNFTSEFIFPNT